MFACCSMVLAKRASQEGNKGNQDGFEAILIAHVWAPQFAKMLKNIKGKLHFEPFCVVCWSLFSPLRPDVFKDAFKCFPAYQ